MNTFTVPEGLTLTVHDELALTGQHNDAAFYIWGNYDRIATVSKGDEDLFSVYSVGEMRIYFEDSQIRLTNDLFDNGIDNDTTLSRLDNDKWDNNPWFEIFDDRDEEFTSEIIHSVAEAIERAIEMAAEVSE